MATQGTVVFPKSGAAIATNSRTILGIDAYLVSHLAGVAPLQGVATSEWLYYWLRTVDMLLHSDNPAYPSLKISRLASIPLPLPPLDEQRRIAARLSEQTATVEKARQAVRAQVEAARALRPAFMRSVLESEETLSWPKVRLGEVCEIQLGKMLSPERRAGIRPRPYLRNANVQWGRFDLSEIYEMDLSEEDEARLASLDAQPCGAARYLPAITRRLYTVFAQLTGRLTHSLSCIACGWVLCKANSQSLTRKRR
jgi:hypothetical protein